MNIKDINKELEIKEKLVEEKINKIWKDILTEETAEVVRQMVGEEYIIDKDYSIFAEEIGEDYITYEVNKLDNIYEPLFKVFYTPNFDRNPRMRKQVEYENIYEQKMVEKEVEINILEDPEDHFEQKLEILEVSKSFKKYIDENLEKYTEDILAKKKALLDKANSLLEE